MTIIHLIMMMMMIGLKGLVGSPLGSKDEASCVFGFFAKLCHMHGDVADAGDGAADKEHKQAADSHDYGQGCCCCSLKENPFLYSSRPPPLCSHFDMCFSCPFNLHLLHAPQYKRLIICCCITVCNAHIYFLHTFLAFFCFSGKNNTFEKVHPFISV